MMRIKPKGIMTVSKTNTVHLPVEIVEQLELIPDLQDGTKKVAYVTIGKVGLLFNPESSSDEVIKSVKLLLEDLELRIIKEERKEESLCR